MPIPNNKTNSLVLIMIIALGIVGGYYYDSSFNKSTNIIWPPPIDEKSDFLTFPDIVLNPEALSAAKFKDTRVFGSLPVQGGSYGVANPFSP